MWPDDQNSRGSHPRMPPDSQSAFQSRTRVRTTRGAHTTLAETESVMSGQVAVVLNQPRCMNMVSVPHLRTQQLRSCSI
jgi:hypothetical protein